jgi:hypothetical protein
VRWKSEIGLSRFLSHPASGLAFSHHSLPPCFLSTDLVSHSHPVGEFTNESPRAFLSDLIRDTQLVDAMHVLPFCSTRLQSLMRTLRLTDLDSFTPLVMISDFLTLAATHELGMTILMV